MSRLMGVAVEPPAFEPQTGRAVTKAMLSWTVALFLAATAGCAWGATSVAARKLDLDVIVGVTDTWWAWAIALGSVALTSRSLLRNIATVLTAGQAAVASYYLLKAYWAVGFSSQYRSFSVYLQEDSWLQWAAVVLFAAVPAAIIGTILRYIATIARRRTGPQDAGFRDRR